MINLGRIEKKDQDPRTVAEIFLDAIQNGDFNTANNIYKDFLRQKEIVDILYNKWLAYYKKSPNKNDKKNVKIKKMFKDQPDVLDTLRQLDPYRGTGTMFPYGDETFFNFEELLNVKGSVDAFGERMYELISKRYKCILYK